MATLLDAETHFAFGENWRSFAGLIDDDRILGSDIGINRLFPGDTLEGRTILDIGCGSGLPALSLLRKGAAHVTCIDIDENSVAAARQTLSAHAPAENWSAEVRSVFEMTGQFDVVYSWGVLHHTGDMQRAVACAGSLVKPGGTLAIALYARTPLCAFWKIEKRIYSRLPSGLQSIARNAFGIFQTSLRSAFGRNTGADRQRGMDDDHDIHDWLGGYPYESANTADVLRMLPSFTLMREIQHYSPKTLGILGSGCDEYVLKACEK